VHIVFGPSGLAIDLTRWSFDATDAAGNVRRCADLFF
jgi:hypothetical protein